jgi:hypothetical protein
LFLFLDGVGLGPAGPANPLSFLPSTAFRQLGGGAPWTRALPETATARHLVRPLDATLEVDGLPQSGTGQATLFTGVNCAERVGRHFGPYPHSATHDVLDHENLFHRVQALPSVPDEAVAFANAFPPQFFDASSRRWTVTTRCCAGAGVPLRDLDALRARRAVAADLTAQGWRDALRLDVSPRTPAEAAEALVATHWEHTLTLFEFFQTDKVGHERIDLPPSVLLDRLDQFLGRVLDRLDPTRDTLIITSDHGNLEDTSHTQHTRNPVPLIAYGWAAPHLTDTRTLADVTPSIAEALRTGLGEQ